MGVQLLYSHKKQFHHSLGLGTHGEEALLFLAKQGIKGVDISSTAPAEIDDKKSLFILRDVDDALTAEKYPVLENTAKIFQIAISHHQHNFDFPSLVLTELDIHIFSIRDNFALVLLGKKAQTLHSFFSSGLSWSSKPSFLGFEARSENKVWVESVEKERWAAGTPLFPVGTSRIFDRAILYWEGLDAGALRDLLIKDHGVPADLLETLSLHRWHETRLLTQFEKRGWSGEVLRGCLFISAQLSSDSAFKKKLTAAQATLNKISSF